MPPRRQILTCLFVCVSLVAATGCERAADDRVVVSYWEKWTGFEGAAIQAVVDDFNASQDRVFVKKLTVSQIDQKFLLATAGGNPPDVVGLWSHSVPVFAEKGAFEPLDRLASEHGIVRENYLPVFWDLCEHAGILWSLPTTPATVALHWNKKLFREAGLDPNQPPRSIAELDAMSDRLTVVEVRRDGRTVCIPFVELTEAERTERKFTIARIGFMPSDSWFTPMWGYWFGAPLWNGRDTVTPTSPENLAAFEWFASYADRYGRDNIKRLAASFGNFNSPQNPFITGQVAMVHQGVWMFNFIQNYNPALEWGAAAFPSVDPAKLPGVSIAECDVLVIPRGAKHVREAFEFIAFVQKRSSLEKLNLGQRKFSPLAQTSAGFVAGHPNPYINVFLELAGSPNVRTAPQTSVWYQYQDELGVAARKILDGDATPAEALEYARARAQWRMDRLVRRWEAVKEQRLAEWTRP